MQKFSELMRGNELIVAPVALNPIMARLAEEAGFKAIYLSGGSLGWLKCVTEANLTLPELAAVALDMRAVCQLPIVLDAGGGWGDPVHVHRTVALAEAAGFAAIELEDQLLPRRVEHHVGVDHLISTELMLKKIAEAITARTDPDFVIIARTNARRVYDLDEALRRAEAFHKAGADMLFVHTRNAEEMRIVGERLPPPPMTLKLCFTCHLRLNDPRSKPRAILVAWIKNQPRSARRSRRIHYFILSNFVLFAIFVVNYLFLHWLRRKPRPVSAAKTSTFQ